MKIADHMFGPGHTLVVAELSSNHGGSLDRALGLVDEAANAGADAIKLQCYTPLEMTTMRGNGRAPHPWEAMTLGELYTHFQTPWDWFPAIFTRAHKHGLIAFSSVFGIASLKFLEGLECPAYKIAAPDCYRHELVRAVKGTGKPVIASTNAPVRLDLPDAVLWCPEGYPQPRAQLEYIRTLDGYSCHRAEPLLGALAVANGAWIVEFHLGGRTRSLDLPDSSFWLDPRQFARMIELVREAECIA